jgi:hypothetical protein
MASTSSEVGGWFSGGIGHKLAQAYGMFLASGCVVFVALSVLLGSRTEIKRVACSTPNSESRGRPRLE